MGKIGFIERLSIKKQLISTFILIMLLSLVLTAVTYILGFWWLTSSSWFNPANHYEQKIPAIAAYSRSLGEAVLDPASRPKLEEKIPGEGIKYQVMDAGGKALYGTLTGTVFKQKGDLVQRLNTSFSRQPSIGFGGVITKIVPVTSSSGELRGAIALEYKLEVTSNGGPGSADILKFAMNICFLAAPFIYIALFTYIFAARFGRRISRPVHELIDASERIRRQDLDFTITYKAANELGLLTDSFEKMRAALKDSLLREWKLEQERRDMMDAIAHDLRTPMTIIQGNVEMLTDTAGVIPRDKLEERLRVVEGNIQRVNRLIQDIQVASEKDMEYFPLYVKETDVAEFAGAKEREIRYLCAGKQIRLEYTVTDERPEPYPVYMDVQRVGQVLDNVITNSLRYVPEQGSLSVSITIREKDIRYEICDTGPGFNEADIPNLFRKFYKGDKGQTGLGLYTARVICDKHGGGIQASNRPEGGACITFTVRTDMHNRESGQ
ncbi:cell wall metabolism sensor histidine kinase WalK [Paenibacillus sp. Y412MC10]|uniref:sensor histidine kinase n=1 Tax=Geobacillus sp. (strain Y412MC10) TaxID=481743 RepID=UPI0011AB7E9D|nr:HAMP domain-containing sensor histidine kinase [Paenibacillus sp. Y412MC10]